MDQRTGFVSYGSTDEHLSQLIRACAEQRSELWTVAEGAEVGDLIVFYFTRPVAAFLACGRVVEKSEKTWGDDKKPMAKIGIIRMFPEPVTLKRAQERLNLRWLHSPQGFARRRQQNVALLLALAGANA